MKTALIIPIYNQAKYWSRMQYAIEQFSVIPNHVYVMMDRQPEKDYQYITKMTKSSGLRCKYTVTNVTEYPEYVGKPTSLPDQNLFLTGHRRNLGIEKAIRDGHDCFVFIDGDCVPEKDLILAHNEANSCGVPNLTNGRRKEEKYGWKDQRDVDRKMGDLSLFTHNDRYVIHNPDLLKTCSITWSCNLSANLAAVNAIMDLNEHYYGRREFFNGEFLGSWGGEDSFLGVQALVAKVFITVINDELSGIRHIEHDRPTSKYGDQAFGPWLIAQLGLFNDMVDNNPLPLEWYGKYFRSATIN